MRSPFLPDIVRRLVRGAIFRDRLYAAITSSDQISGTKVSTAVLSIKGKGRDYFATSQQHLLSTGSSTNPKAIPASDYWVVTNNNTGKKAAILRQVASVMGCSETLQDDVVKALTDKS